MLGKKRKDQLAEMHCSVAIQNDAELMRLGLTHLDITELWMAHAIAHSTLAGMSLEDTMLMFAKLCGAIQASTKAGAS